VTRGKTGAFTLALSSAPTSNVTVSLTASGNAGLTATPTSLTFTPSNYSDPGTMSLAQGQTGVLGVSLSASPSAGVAVSVA
jgi:hypothetical protein